MLLTSLNQCFHIDILVGVGIRLGWRTPVLEVLAPLLVGVAVGCLIGHDELVAFNSNDRRHNILACLGVGIVLWLPVAEVGGEGGGELVAVVVERPHHIPCPVLASH